MNHCSQGKIKPTEDYEYHSIYTFMKKRLLKGKPILDTSMFAPPFKTLIINTTTIGDIDSDLCLRIRERVGFVCPRNPVFAMIIAH